LEDKMKRRIRALRVIKCLAYVGGLASVLLAPPSAFARDGATVRLGDRLKITFFESMNVPDPTASAGNDAATAKMQMFFQRTDLSGEYQVEPGGRISLPILGAIDVEGQTVDGAKANVLAAMTRIMGKTGNITVSIAQRPPVYVAGAVRNPGAYPYAPGMIAIQALALAGGLDRDATQTAQFIEMMRQKETRAIALDHLKKALARKEVFVAARENIKDVTPPPRLIGIAGSDGAATLIATERGVVDLRLQVQQKARATSAAAVTAIQDEIGLLKERLTNVDAQIKARADELQKMEGLLANRIVSDERVSNVRRDYLDMEGRRNDLKVNLVRAKQRLGQAEADLQTMEIAQRLEIEQEIKQIDAQIAEIDQQSLLGEGVSALTGGVNLCGPKSAELEIVRNGAHAAEVVQATDTSAIEPGDVLRVAVGCQSGAQGKQTPVERSARDGVQK
jgi:protein involved in polysaccharide export with SLBB domain